MNLSIVYSYFILRICSRIFFFWILCTCSLYFRLSSFCHYFSICSLFAKGKKRKNTIFSLEDSDSIIKEQNQLLEHATWYYKTLFGPSIDPIMEMDSDCWEDNEKISEADNAKLTSPFSEEEVKRTIFDMEKNTALGHGSARR